jgi:carboxypeptidase T
MHNCNRILGLITFILFVCFQLEGQKTYHRARVSLKDKNVFLLAKAGIALDHGKMALGRYFESDFDEDEIRVMRQMGYKVDVTIKDLESYYANQDRPSENRLNSTGDRFTSCKKDFQNIKTPTGYFDGSMGGYFTYDEMLLALDVLKTTYPGIIGKLETVKGPKTNDGNVIHYFKLSDNPNVAENEPKVLYTALHHAREPNSLSQMIFYLFYLCENYGSNPEIKYLVDNTEMYFIPCVNPDGYKLNEKNKPNGGGMWRKNTWRNSQGSLTGVDLNRNYGYNWGFNNVGSSNNPASETYRGGAPFSEVETSAVRDFLLNNKILMSLNYHSFGNLLIHPWGYSDGPTIDNNVFKSIANQMTKFNNFTTGTGSETVGYTVNGDADDYMYGEQVEKDKIFSMTPEVGPTFWPLKSEIDGINKSSLELNLSLPRMVNGYLYPTIVNKTTNYEFDDELILKISKPSFNGNPVNIEVWIGDKETSIKTNAVLNLKQGQDTTLIVNYNINPRSLDVGYNQVNVFFQQSLGEYKHLDSLKITIFKGDRISLFKNQGNNLTGLTTTSKWGLSTSSDYYTSDPSSFTDSPITIYKPSSKNSLIFKTPVNLRDAISPYLTYNARWQIEQDFDYARVFAFVPGKDTVNLCGAFTTTGNIDQLNNQPIYEGSSKGFVREVINLEYFIGESQVYIGFELVADSGLELDGMYVDDVEVVSFQKSTAIEEDLDIKGKISISPNPSSGLINFNEMVDSGKLEVYDINGILKETVYIDHLNSISLKHLDAGIYITKLQTKKSVFTNKLILIK